MAKGWIIHAIFRCSDTECGWYSEDYQKAQREAALHARHYGHKVTGEVGRHVEYEPSKKDVWQAEIRRRRAMD